MSVPSSLTIGSQARILQERSPTIVVLPKRQRSNLTMLRFFAHRAIRCAVMLCVYVACLSFAPIASPAAHRATMPAARHPHDANATGIRYHHGPTMRTGSVTYTIFWTPHSSYVSPTYASLINRFFADFGGTSLYAIATQYGDTAGANANRSWLGGTWTDTDPYPLGANVQDAAIQHEIARAEAVNGWTGGLGHLFVVYTAESTLICKGSDWCAFDQFCAYHSNFGTTPYIVVPYLADHLDICGTTSSPNDDPAADAAINLSSHEQLEAVTDPLGTGWYDSQGNEIGDVCAWIFGAMDATGADVTWNGHPYILQEEWDARANGCALAGP
jgi:hypothetical protein